MGGTEQDEGGREGGNEAERGRDGTRERERGEGGRERRRDRARKGGSNGARERIKGEQERSEGGREEGSKRGREANFKGGTLRMTLASWPMQYTMHKTTHNSLITLETVVL